MTQGCPICGYPGFREFHPEGGSSYDLCPSCGFESGVDAIGWDRSERDRIFRARWVAGGAQWWSQARAPEPGWSGMEQLRRAGLLDTTKHDRSDGDVGEEP